MREFSCWKLLGNGWGRGIAIRFVALRERLWNRRPQQEKCKCSDGSQRQERDAIAEVLNQLAAKRRAEGCAQPNCGCKTALDKIEPACRAGSVRVLKNRDFAKDRVCNAVEQLDSNQALGIV